MQTTLRNLPLLLLAVGGCRSLTAIAQSNAPSPPNGGNIYSVVDGSDTSRTREIGLQSNLVDHPATTHLGPQYTVFAATPPAKETYLMMDPPSVAVVPEIDEVSAS